MSTRAASSRSVSMPRYVWKEKFPCSSSHQPPIPNIQVRILLIACGNYCLRGKYISERHRCSVLTILLTSLPFLKASPLLKSSSSQTSLASSLSEQEWYLTIIIIFDSAKLNTFPFYRTIHSNPSNLVAHLTPIQISRKIFTHRAFLFESSI